MWNTETSEPEGFQDIHHDIKSVFKNMEYDQRYRGFFVSGSCQESWGLSVRLVPL